MNTKIIILISAIMMILINVEYTIAQEEIYTLSSLTRISDAIIQGKVIDIFCFEKQQGRIYSKIKVKINKPFKGHLLKDQIIIFEYLGGTLGNLRQIIPELPQFVINEDVVLFLKKYDTNMIKYYDLLGASQGKFNIIIDGNNNEKVFRDRLVTEKLQVDSAKNYLDINYEQAISLNLFLSTMSTFLENK